MYPVLFDLGGLEIRSYTVLVDIGIIVGAIFAYLEAKRSGFNLNRFVDVLMITVIVAIIGARVYYIVLNLPEFNADWTRAWQLWLGGLAFHGGLAGGALAIIFMAWRQRLPIWHLADIGAIGVAVGQGIGRLGCFLNGCCYGGPTNVPWGVVFPALGDEHRHPTQVYEAIGYLSLFALLWGMRKRKPFHGFLFGSYMVLHGAIRFAVEGLRDDSVFLGGFRVAQLVSLAEIVIALCIITYLWRRASSLRYAA